MNLCLYVCILLVGCQRNDNYYFNGEIKIVECQKELNVIGKQLHINGIYTGAISVYDSLMIFVDSSYPDHFMTVFNLNTNQQVASLLAKGKGPGEFYDITYTDQFISNDHSIKLWLSEYPRDKIILLNLTESIKKGETMIDSTISIEWKEKWQSPFSQVFVLNDDIVFAKDQNERLYYNSPSYMPGKYHFYEGSIDRELKSYALYNEAVPLANGMDVQILTSLDRIKPDNCKLAMAMRTIAQINILDIETGVQKGFRLKNTPGFDYLSYKHNQYKFFYTDICVDNDFIYALFANIPYTEAIWNAQEVHVFDWNGVPVCKINLDKKLVRMSLNPKGRILYGMGDEDEIYQYDISSIYTYKLPYQ